MYKLLLIALVLINSLLFGMSANQAEKPFSMPENPNHQFCYDLLQNLDTTENLFLSSFSIRTALAMVYAGAKGNTAKQMQQVLYFDNSEDFQAAFASQTNSVKQVKYSQLNIANALWVQQDFQLLNSYQKKLQKYYQTEAYKLNFSTPASLEKSRQKINRWVEAQTKNKIKDLIKPGILQPTTRVVLTDAIYFLGNWEFPFDPKNNFEDYFYAAAEKQQTDFMRKELTINYTENPKYQLVQIPYKRNELYLEILLPKANSNIDDVLGSLTNNEKQHSKPKPERVEVIIPKFKLTKTLNLKVVLQKMGMKDVFGNDADLSGMNKQKALYLSAVLHKAFVQVDETGTEAAAATGGVVAIKSAPPVKNKIFRADHPFLFLIKHRETGTILFSGVLQNIQ
jgi:serpin B